ncbi:unnamed protein product (macronuclear) [Paramecium tetraurelia]|uniref:Derlin n=1 Tax=Paramecium tetraurelia TaxID=5888 RepID=A0CFP1_PARTE|nr:uncharacterized protein GSPATT00038048001 [Paramecium tetraurelia]CAK69608.1 unnamed protein product [Paramecium tetraurelia]|eukprot:XP_001437005.1 hypothetical protein (macronuclear) [Paramecium tetraurelia strain d4-2]
MHTFAGFANYLYYLLLNFIVITLLGLWMNEYSLTEFLIEALMYVWGRKNEQRPLLFLFFIQIQAQYMVWFLLFLNLISGKSIQSNLVGVMIGHTFYYFAFIVPNLPRFKGLQLLSTPKFLINICKYFERQNQLQ